MDFQSQLMQRKVARVSGERTIEEKEEHNKKAGCKSLALVFKPLPL